VLGWCTSDGINFFSNSAAASTPFGPSALLTALGLAAVVAQLFA